MAHDEGQVCRCSAEHRPAILEYQRHHILPMSMNGPDVESNIAWLCPSGHVNTHELLRMMMVAGKPLSDGYLQTLYDRPVSRHAARLARDGFTRWRTQVPS